MRRSVVITGGNRGIGRSIVQSFVEAGYKVIVGSRNENSVVSIDRERVIFQKTDASKETDQMMLAKVALQETGRLDVWVNNAGLSAWKPIEKIDHDFFNQMVDVNLKGAFWGCKAAAKFMTKTGASIINISSIAGKRGSSNNSMYCATKFGLNGLTQSLAKELGPRGIRVNAICPVLIKTDGLIDALEEPFSPAMGNPESFLTSFTHTNSATGSLPTGQDVGSLAVYLSSPKNKAITGQCINVDCGVFPQ